MTSLGGGEKKRKRGSTRNREIFFVFKYIFKSLSAFNQREASEDLKAQVDEKDLGYRDNSNVSPLSSALTFEEQLRPWRKSMISFSNCYSSGTAEWGKHV